MLTFFLAALTLSSLVNLSQAAPATTNIWAISIFRGPAPSAEKGPPASAHALRDPSKLKYEIIGIVAAAVVWTLVTAVALLLIGRRLRRNSEESNQTLRMEPAKPLGQITVREIDAPLKSPLSPKSPGKLAGLKSWARGSRTTNRQSEAASLSTIDTRVVEQDKSKNMDEMAKLYAAVMAHDEHKTRSSAGSSPITQHDSPITPTSPRSPQYYDSSYPIPENSESMPPPPLPATNDDRESLLSNQSPARKTKTSALSIMSNHTRLGSSTSNKARPSPITLRGQSISRPMGSADPRQSTFSDSQASLPSVYSPGPPPPTPGQKTPRTAVTEIEEIEMHGVPQLTLHPNDSAVSTSRALPFRQFYQEPLRSAPPTKTTFVDRRTGGNGPKTSVPMTPYSPYCPTTPMTPVTPRRLLTKEDIKKQKKQNALKVVRENDLVQSDTDMWGTE
ncbi:hypothetical protein H2198_001033 [Neophaeococcomyces mojaviensis]|uniref:Uncharacterized protein n=1 Tax=Neophaeococcomyces mojaviensis TaxID=3383035 RepID=A0ACC3AI66_9EURO|nr:hypothetical protein H2198_001033 [Knufia sp. JES_112]